MEKRLFRMHSVFQISLKEKRHPRKSDLKAYGWSWKTRNPFHEALAHSKLQKEYFSNQNELSVWGCSGISRLRFHIYILKASFRLLPYIIHLLMIPVLHCSLVELNSSEQEKTGKQGSEHLPTSAFIFRTKYAISRYLLMRSLAKE